MTARADDDQVRLLLLGLLVQAAARRARNDADELCVGGALGAFAFEQLLGGFALLSQQRRGDRVRGAQLTAVHVYERQLPSGIRQVCGERDRIAAIWPAIHSHQHVLEHRRLLWIVYWRC